VYKVEIMNGNLAGVPASYFYAGNHFSVEYSPVERGLSRKVGDKLDVSLLLIAA